MHPGQEGFVNGEEVCYSFGKYSGAVRRVL